MILAAPWTGYGYGGFEGVFLRNYLTDRAFDPSMRMIEYALTHPHNELLYWGVEGGIVPMLGILIAIGTFLMRLARTPWRAALPLLALVSPLTVHVQTELPFYHSAAHWFVLLLLVYFVDVETRFAARDRERSRHPAGFSGNRVPALVVPSWSPACSPSTR
jgi:O-antigen polymerase